MIEPRYRDMLLADGEPGDIYRRCLEAIERDGLACDYALTETIVYATEMRYALQYLQQGRPAAWHNFGDLIGDADTRMWRELDPLPRRHIAFVGAGPLPVTAFQIRDRYADARLVCVDNHIVAHLMSQALIERFDLRIESVFAEALEVDYADFDVVIVAAMVSAKVPLVDRILEGSQARVLLRGTVPRQHERLLQLGSAFAEDGSFNA